ncbi:alpha-ketoglutarate-dependent taurine dioxygenase [Aspergillus nomiae NRRL 13137]|uniref:Alpha-ketoglutarate-dependent taurine dioxygenase n=1 Tax=Aspergillus nomiae NRRL (strain ATCC 15546 / NRRL 13137 / CBS 260.88 / M93) TaxID=1509407 RepID=A0A0L1J0Z2_ASPN3|nr:alpha-ketoglutarate-dependent taurine dioxygenase [Aspergillus nomiae NRRL 13137]KNG85451.1 alpha-ketoglutarate-dependent taurine dioxygenase [Aspergillus nomiae NRRL 13137]
MAPSITETVSLHSAPKTSLRTDAGHNKENGVGYRETYQHENEIQGTAKQPPASFPKYLPVWDNETEKYPPLQPFEHYDHGKDADPTFPDLFPEGKGEVEELTPTIGSEVHGIQLSQLTDKGKEQLALYIAQRKVVAFRDQDFAQLPIEKALEFGSYFGRHHIHQSSGAPKGFPEIHLVHRGADDRSGAEFLETHTNSLTWHSDVTFEKQPPGTTFLYLLDGPTSGGDTLFCNMAQAYRRLSPEFRKRLHGLKAVHSGVEQVNNSLNKGGIARRDPITTEHPIVRTHPVTGEKALFVNPQFTRYIVGYKKEESDFLLKFLYDHIALSQDIQTRVRWRPNTVVVWDNRVVAHSAIFDWEDGQRRHLARITPQAERPYETPFEG